MSEIEWEEIPGLPEKLPPGERILWRGAPNWRGLAWRAFHVRDVMVWFAAIFGWHVATSIAHGDTMLAALRGHVWLVPICIVACAILGALGWAAARTTIYTMTDRRLVIRTGIALPVTINLPFVLVRDADLRLYRDGSGDVAIAFSANTRLAWLVLWPHVRPWKVSRPQPMLRCIDDASSVADQLSQALGAVAGAGAFVRTAAGPATVPARLSGDPLPAGGVGAAS